MWLFLVGCQHFEELSFSVNLPVSFSTSDPKEFGVAKFARLFFHLAPDEIHPLALLIPTALFFYYIFCIVVAMKTRCSVEYKLVNPFFNFHSPCLPHQKGVSHLLHAQGLSIGSFFSHQFLILEKIWLVGEGVTTPNVEYGHFLLLQGHF